MLCSSIILLQLEVRVYANCKISTYASNNRLGVMMWPQFTTMLYTFQQRFLLFKWEPAAFVFFTQKKNRNKNKY